MKNTGAKIIDSALTRAEALSGSPLVIPQPILDNVELMSVDYWGFDGALHGGQLVVARDLVADVRDIFAVLCEARFPVEKVRPVSFYGWSDDDSMADNNTSGFNYRTKPNSSELSLHAQGRAVDINPRLNPYIKGGLVLPSGATYDPAQPGSIVADDVVVQAFESRGWSWGGRWNHLKDYQHFEKPSSERAL